MGQSMGYLRSHAMDVPEIPASQSELLSLGHREDTYSNNQASREVKNP